MDLIYADAQKVDIGIMKDYDFDLAYGTDENDFSLTIDLKKHCCEDDYFVYMIDPSEGTEAPTEYGGIIDTVAVDTSGGTVKYSGRTWHGILSHKIIEPEKGQDYRIVSGNAANIITDLLADADLLWLFEVEQSPIDISGYSFNRYTDLYSGICKMLSQAGGKLLIRYEKKKVVLSAVWKVDYSQDEEWDSTQVDFQVAQNKNPLNHLICLGTGSLRHRHVIHLFTDENGGIQPYAFSDNPVKDSDYILDKSKQVLNGQYEVCEAYDYASAADTENFILLSSQPSDWGRNYGKYYKQSNDGQFQEVEGVQEEQLSLLTSQPSDWTTRYSNYYTANGDSVEGVETEQYIKLTQKPADWDKSWTSYYTHFWDGVQWYWRSVESLTKTIYKVQTKKPTDWETNYGTYYQLASIEVAGPKRENDSIISVTYDITRRVWVGTGFARVEAEKRGGKQVKPKWKKGRYYTAYSSSYAPNFSSGLDKYRQDKNTVAPTWMANKYYSKTTVTIAPVFKSKMYYQRFVDHYAELVKYGIERLQQGIREGDSVSVNLSLWGEYDIGDIVGASEQVTGVSVWQEITKKIVKIKNSERTITYKIGANL